MSDPNYADALERQLWTLIDAAYYLSENEPPAKQHGKTEFDMRGAVGKVYADLKDAIDLRQIDFIESRDGLIHGRRVRPADVITWAAERRYVIPPPLLHLKKRDPNETPEQRKTRLARRVDEVKKTNKAFLKTVAAEEGISKSRLQQVLSNKKALSDSKGKAISKGRKQY